MRDRFARRLARLSLRLTDEQMDAALHGPGPLLVHAGPGSGKTAVITCRSAFLHWELGVRPDQIAIFTFTRKSAAELRERLKRLDPALVGVHAGTFHSLFLRWLLRAGKENPRLTSTGERRHLLEQALRHSGRSARKENVEEFEQHLALAAAAKTALPQPWLAAADWYRRLKRERGLWDFDDILPAFQAHFAMDEGFAAHVREAAQYVMVDEFQDTDPAEWACLQAIAGKRGNIAAVGDDDQCIYRFRGAEPKLLQLFRSRWPRVREIVLRRNFRSADPIVALSQRLIAHNRERTAKAMTGAVGAGPRVVWVALRDSLSEAQYVARETERILRDKERTIGVLARTNLQLALVAEALRKVGVAYAGQTEFLYDQSYVAPLLRFLRAACGPVACGQAFADYLRWSGARERADRMEWEAQTRDELIEIIRKSPGRQALWERFARLLDDVAPRTPAAALDRLLALYLPYLKRLERASDIRLEAAFGALDALRDRASSVGTLDAWLAEIDALYIREPQRPAMDSVQLLTFHGAKGLEFDRVHVIGLQEGLTPHVKALSDDADERDRRAALEEERRLLYVALTRARTELHLSYARRTGERDAAPSRFATELGFVRQSGAGLSGRHGEKRPVFSAARRNGPGRYETGRNEARRSPTDGAVSAVLGERVRHRLFGAGIITSVEDMSPSGHKVGIIFNGQDMRYFYWEMAIQAGHLVIGRMAEKGSTQ